MNEINQYHQIITACWKFLKKHIENAPKAADDWGPLMNEMCAALQEWHDTEYFDFAKGVFWKVTEEIERLYKERSAGS